MAKFKSVWLPTGKESIFDAANIELAWQKAIETYKESLVRELLPSFFIYNDSLESSKVKDDSIYSSVATFKQIKASDFLTVEKLDRIKMTVVTLELVHSFYIHEPSTPKQVIKRHIELPENFEIDLINARICEQLISKSVQKITFDLRIDQTNKDLPDNTPIKVFLELE